MGGTLIRARWSLVAMTLALVACGGEETAGPVGPVSPASPGSPWDTLSEWSLFRDGAGQTPNDRVVPYDVISPLYSDYAHKRRFIWIPEGALIGYQPESDWQFPVGTILVKTFSYLNDARDPSLGERLLETRLLVHEPNEWTAQIYIWNAEQTEAVHEVAGDVIPYDFIDPAGRSRHNDYIVPNANECQDCHGETPDIDTLGGRTRQLDRIYDYGAGQENQIDHLTSLGLLDSTPPVPSERQRLVDPFGGDALELRVRSYLDSNCGHCHTTGGLASESALLLSFDLTDPSSNDASNWGVCKTPTSAGGATCGHTNDIQPGEPDTSIFICRLTSTEPKVRMPPLVSRIPHDEGVALVSEWIAAMTPGCSAM
jgi:uncharacterized repeat protein (TIGR03806 family)